MAHPCVFHLTSRAHTQNGVRWAHPNHDTCHQAAHAARHRTILARAGRDYFDSPFQYMEQEMRRMDQDMAAMDRDFSRMNRMVGPRPFEMQRHAPHSAALP